MPALPTGLITQLSGESHRPKLAKAYMSAIDLAEGESPPWMEKGFKVDPGIVFQYWPESISDTRPSEWNPRNIPGGSHPIYQWTHGGERRLSFTAVFTRDHEPPHKQQGGGLLGDVVSGLETLQSDIQEAGFGGPGVDKTRNVPITEAIRWLRYFTYPYYGDGDLRVFEPPKCLLVLTGSQLNINGQDGINCVMTTCDVTYEAWFPDGSPRIVEVSLEFAEVVQADGKIAFHNRADMARVDELREIFGKTGDDGSGSLLEDVAGAIAGGLGL